MKINWKDFYQNEQGNLAGVDNKSNEEKTHYGKIVLHFGQLILEFRSETSNICCNVFIYKSFL